MPLILQEIPFFARSGKPSGEQGADSGVATGDDNNEEDEGEILSEDEDEDMEVSEGDSSKDNTHKKQSLLSSWSVWQRCVCVCAAAVRNGH